MIDSCIRLFFNKLYIEKTVYQTVPKLEVRLVLPFLGHTSLRIKRHLLSTFAKLLPMCKLTIIFKTPNRLSGQLKSKENVPKQFTSHMIYKYVCDSCKAVYIGKTFRHRDVRIAEHQGRSLRTGKVVQWTCTTSVREQQLDILL